MALGQDIVERGVDGVVFHSPERPAGNRYAVLNAQSLERAIQGDHYRYVWDGTRINELYSFNQGDVIDPEDLQREKRILPAAAQGCIPRSSLQDCVCELRVFEKRLQCGPTMRAFEPLKFGIVAAFVE